MLTEASSPNEYRRAIRHLRSGIASPSAARLITVATDAAETTISKYQRAWLNGSPTSNMVFIHGDWGFGKSHIRMLLVDSFHGQGIPYVSDHVDGKSGSLAHLHRAVPRWLESVHLGSYTGIRSVVEGALNNPSGIKDWCRRHNTWFAWQLGNAMRGIEWAWDLVPGHQFQFPDSSFNHMKALEALLASAALFSAFSKGGIALLLDEAENVSRQHDIRGRRKTYDTLGRLARVSHLLIFVFVTDRFYEQIRVDTERGTRECWTNWTPLAQEFVNRISSVPVVTTPRLSDALAGDLVRKIAHVYQQAFKCSVPSGFSEQAIATWKRTATKSVRLLVRITIDELDRIAP
jgi:hypothetical protein